MIDENKKIAEIFHFVAEALSYQGENHFKVRSYSNFVRQLDELDTPISHIAELGKLKNIHGVGEAIEKKIEEFLQTGTFPLADKLNAELPTLVKSLLESCLSGTKVKKLEQEGILCSPDELKKRIASGEGLENFSPAQRKELIAWSKC